MTDSDPQLSFPKHPAGAAFVPQECLDLPQDFDTPTRHAVRRRLNDDQPVWLLTEGGRAVFCAHLSASDPWIAYPQDFLDEISHFSRVSPPASIKNWQFHLVNLLWRYQDFAFRRSDLEHVKKALHEAMRNHPHPEWFPAFSEDSDVIQNVNKTGQWGIKHQAQSLATAAGATTIHYLLRRPLEYDRRTREEESNVRQPEIPPCACPPHGSQDTPEGVTDSLGVQRARVIDHLYDTWISRPLNEWTLDGHRDPDNKDSGLVAQPSEYNRHMRSKYKFDEYGLKECPAAEYLASNLDKFYPTQEEQILLLEALRKSSTTLQNHDGNETPRLHP